MGGTAKCVIGSETLKYINPIPIPAENNMANQESNVNSGFAFLPPNRCFPNFPNPITRLTIRKILTPKTNNHPKLEVMVCVRSSKNNRTGSPPPIATTTNNKISMIEGKNTCG